MQIKLRQIKLQEELIDLQNDIFFSIEKSFEFTLGKISKVSIKKFHIYLNLFIISS